ncbi:MAG: hypothetical protein M0Q23_00485 [Syntrophales bacterium]|nr:hypothetical protein [Syntrophales bacterium]MCK9527124.1 hypothetical protein [Syntrophales bacterium]MDX9921751.1 hypothetical protein [Syntrophales bacterium]
MKGKDSCNVFIIGSGPAALFAAIRLEELGMEGIIIADRNSYPAGGLLNDGKLNFDHRVGIDLEELQIDIGRARELMESMKKILTGFPHLRQVTFTDRHETVDVLREIAREQNVEFIAPEQWHWGTDNGKAAVDYLRNRLKKTIFFLGTEVISIEKAGKGIFDLLLQDGTRKFRHSARVLLVAPGRSGAYWFRDRARKLGIDNRFGPIDVGIRLELNRSIYDPVTSHVYDPKFIFLTAGHGDRVRTFCTNPGGRVRFEAYESFKLVNGDALHRKKSGNTNFALINTVALTEPFSDTTEFGRMIARQFFLLGDGTPIVQRVGDFREGRRSTRSTFNSKIRHFDFCKASCTAVPGDIGLGMPARIMDNLWEALKKMDKIVPGILHPSTLMYAPEIKFFDTNFPTTADLETNMAGLFVAGDGTGKSRGIVGAGISGIIAAEGLFRNYFS